MSTMSLASWLGARERFGRWACREHLVPYLEPFNSGPARKRQAENIARGRSGLPEARARVTNGHPRHGDAGAWPTEDCARWT
jgi:hypothetical protein